MSSTNRGALRRSDDAYETPAWCVHRLLDSGALTDWLKGRGTPEVWLEPACGSGAIIRAVDSWVESRRMRATSEGWGAPSWYAQDIRPEAIEALGDLVSSAGTAHLGDFLKPGPSLWGEVPPDVVITNPPFSLAEQFVRRALASTRGQVAMLLRLGWLSSAKRAPLLHEMPPDVYVLPDRPSFTGDGATDSADYCWCVWGPADERERRCGGFRVLATTPGEERRAPRRDPFPESTIEMADGTFVREADMVPDLGVATTPTGAESAGPPVAPQSAFLNAGSDAPAPVDSVWCECGAARDVKACGKCGQRHCDCVRGYPGAPPVCMSCAAEEFPEATDAPRQQSLFGGET